jgi:hypothetical protein
MPRKPQNECLFCDLPALPGDRLCAACRARSRRRIAALVCETLVEDDDE